MSGPYSSGAFWGVTGSDLTASTGHSCASSASEIGERGRAACINARSEWVRGPFACERPGAAETLLLFFIFLLLCCWGKG